MNILFYCPFNFDLKSKFLNQLGGIETLNLGLSRLLADKGYKIFLSTNCKNIIKRKNLINLPLNYVLTKKNKLKFDYIISSNDTEIFNFYKSSRKIFWMHNTLAIEKAIRKKKFITLIKNKITTVFVSKYLKNATSKIYLFNKELIIPNFLSKEFDKIKINYKRKKIIIWSVQRNRGLQETLDMWIKSVYPRNKDAMFYIFGISKKNYSQNISFYKKYNIFFFDRVSKIKLRNLYLKSQGMICLGYDETFCLNALEGNSCGLPVFTFGKTALNELIHDNKNGLISNDFDQLGFDLNKFLNSDYTNKKCYIKNSYNYSKKFTLDKIASHWIKLLK
jgi:glycosyltransferase involved in cell wall biosynthesis